MQAPYAIRVLVLGGVLNLVLSFVLGWVLSLKRMKEPMTKHHWLLVAHTVSLQEGLMLLGLGFAMSFAVLVLSVVAAREVAHPAWSAAELDAQIAAAVAYAGRETDLRGYTGAAGWAHAAAHTADWVKFLARHPALTRAQATRLLGAITALAARAPRRPCARPRRG